MVRENEPEYAVLPYDEYQAMVARLEDLEDIAVADKVLDALERGEEELIPAEMVKALIEGENPIRVWREHRGMAQRALAQAAGVTTAHISQLETNKRRPSVEVLHSVAGALAVDMDDLLPAK